jgi:hypothetical protein
MATPLLNETSLDLSFKLQDPVASGDADGARMTADGRLRYITRAYRRFIRIATELYPQLVGRAFKGLYVQDSFTTDIDGNVQGIDFSNLYSIYAKWATGPTEYTKVEFVQQSDFPKVAAGENEFFKPDLNEPQLYFSVVDSNVKILPAVEYNDVQILYRRNVPTFTYGGTEDLDIPQEFLDILLSLAAYEAYLDIGQVQGAAAFKEDAYEQIRILTVVKQERKQEDEQKEESKT